MYERERRGSGNKGTLGVRNCGDPIALLTTIRDEGSLAYSVWIRCRYGARYLNLSRSVGEEFASLLTKCFCTSPFEYFEIQ